MPVVNDGGFVGVPANPPVRTGANVAPAAAAASVPGTGAAAVAGGTDGSFSLLQAMLFEQMRGYMSNFADMLQAVPGVPSTSGTGAPWIGLGSSAAASSSGVRPPPGFAAVPASSFLPTAGVAGFTGRLLTSAPLISAGAAPPAPPVSGVPGSSAPPATSGLPASSGSADAGTVDVDAGLAVQPDAALQQPTVQLPSTADQRQLPAPRRRRGFPRLRCGFPRPFS